MWASAVYIVDLGVVVEKSPRVYWPEVRVCIRESSWLRGKRAVFLSCVRVQVTLEKW